MSFDTKESPKKKKFVAVYIGRKDIPVVQQIAMSVTIMKTLDGKKSRKNRTKESNGALRQPDGSVG